MRIINDLKLDFSDVLIQPKRSTLKSRKEVDLLRTFTLLHSGREWNILPICAANMDSVASFEMANVLANHKCITAIHKHYTTTQLVNFFAETIYRKYVFYSLGITDADIKKFEEVSNQLNDFHISIENVCIDVANGYTQAFVEFVKRFRDNHPNINLMVGNVVTPEMTEELILSGADIVKIGIGPGSVCTTRKMTGVGYPQLSAVIECADAAHGVKGLVCADGGCTVPGDIAKAFGGGADIVMLGGMLAGHDESGGEIVREVNTGKIIGMKFYGMSSDTAMNKHNGGVAEYRASEGKTVVVPYRGSVEITLQEILGGLRSSCTYVGASKLKELSKRTTFIRVNNQINNIYTGKEVK